MNNEIEKKKSQDNLSEKVDKKKSEEILKNVGSGKREFRNNLQLKSSQKRFPNDVKSGSITRSGSITNSGSITITRSGSLRRLGLKRETASALEEESIRCKIKSTKTFNSEKSKKEFRTSSNSSKNGEDKSNESFDIKSVLSIENLLSVTSLKRIPEESKKKQSVKRVLKSRKSQDKMCNIESNTKQTSNDDDIAVEKSVGNVTVDDIDNNVATISHSLNNKSNRNVETKERNENVESEISFKCPICNLNCPTELKTIEHATKIHFRRELSIKFKKVFEERIVGCHICNQTSKDHLANLNHIGSVHGVIYEFMSPG